MKDRPVKFALSLCFTLRGRIASAEAKTRKMLEAQEELHHGSKNPHLLSRVQGQSIVKLFLIGSPTRVIRFAPNGLRYCCLRAFS